MADAAQSQIAALKELENAAPGVPFLALGQTVLWDEPLKVGVEQMAAEHGFARPLQAGVHDTDYFAKLSQHHAEPGRYAIVSHNDTTTKSLWSAAAEFAQLFGSETVISRELFQAAGLRISKVARERPGALDRATEAWGWRALVSQGESTITAQTKLSPLLGLLVSAYDWALEASCESLTGGERARSIEIADRLRTALCDASEPVDESTLSDFYVRLLPHIQQVCTGSVSSLPVTRTTGLLNLNERTAALPRFKLADLFLRPGSAGAACDAYNRAIGGSEIYTLDRFGSGAIPFDLVVPGHGRGTLRIGRKGLVVMTPQPLFASCRRPIESIDDLARVVEAKFGDGCALVGKAVTLIGMLACEYVFVFHQGASSYVPRCRKLHQELAAAGYALPVKPILRVKYSSWEALAACHAWLKLPEPLRDSFGAEEVSTSSFHVRWHRVREEQRRLLQLLSQLRSPLEFVSFLGERVGGSWHRMAERYIQVRQELDRIHERVQEVKKFKAEVLERLSLAKAKRAETERRMGAHWRERIFERSPTEEDWRERQRMQQIVSQAIEEVRSQEAEWRRLDRDQAEVVSGRDAQAAHAERRNIELEAELMRLKLVRQAVIASDGLDHANLRPCAWWFPVVCPDGDWYRQAARTAEYYLEPLV